MMLCLLIPVLVETECAVQQEDEIQAHSERHYQQPIAELFPERHLQTSSDGRVFNSEVEPSSEDERESSAFLAKTDGSNSQYFVPGSAGPIKHSGSPYKRPRQDFTNSVRSQDRTTILPNSLHLSDIPTSVAFERDYTSFPNDASKTTPLWQGQDPLLPEINSSFDHYPSFNSNRPKSFDSRVTNARRPPQNHERNPEIALQIRSPDHYLTMGRNFAPTIAERSPQNQYHFQPKQETTTSHFSYNQFQPHSSQFAQDTQGLRASRMHEYADGQERCTDPRCYGIQEQAMHSLPPSNLWRQESFIHRETKHADNNFRRADSPGPEIADEILTELEDVFYKTHSTVGEEYVNKKKINRAAAQEMSVSLCNLLIELFRPSLIRQIEKLKIETGSCSGIQQHSGVSIENDSNWTSASEAHQYYPEMFEIGNVPRVIKETRVQRDRPNEEPLVEKISKLTLREIENKEREEPPRTVVRKPSNASSIDSSIADLEPCPAPVATPPVEHIAAHHPIEEEHRASARETAAPERKKSSFRRKFLGCFSFAGNPQPPPAQTTNRNMKSLARTDTLGPSAPVQADEHRLRTTIPNMKRLITLDSDTKRWNVLIWDGEYEGYRELGHFSSEVVARVAHDIYGMKLQNRKAHPVPILFYPRRGYSQLLKRYIANTSPKKLRDELRNSSVTLFSIPIWNSNEDIVATCPPNAPH